VAARKPSGVQSAIATMQDLDELALSMPATTRRTTGDGRPSYYASGKLFCCQRNRRPDAVDEHGEMLDDVLMFRVADLDTKDALLADSSSAFFTTHHFNGYAAVLLRIAHLGAVDRDELFEIVADAWLTRAPKRLASAWLSNMSARRGETA
jgi:hypothetical protein